MMSGQEDDETEEEEEVEEDESEEDEGEFLQDDIGQVYSLPEARLVSLCNEMGLDPKIGSDALELLHLTDAAAEVNVTPDRGYCFSVRGIAREYAHATARGCIRRRERAVQGA